MGATVSPLTLLPLPTELLRSAQRHCFCVKASHTIKGRGPCPPPQPPDGSFCLHAACSGSCLENVFPGKLGETPGQSWMLEQPSSLPGDLATGGRIGRWNLNLSSWGPHISPQTSLCCSCKGQRGHHVSRTSRVPVGVNTSPSPQPALLNWLKQQMWIRVT